MSETTFGMRLSDLLNQLAMERGIHVSEDELSALDKLLGVVDDPKLKPMMTGIRTEDMGMSVAELAKHWGCSTRYVYERIKDGSLKAVKMGKSWVVNEKNRIAYMEKATDRKMKRHKASGRRQ